MPEDNNGVQYEKDTSGTTVDVESEHDIEVVLVDGEEYLMHNGFVTTLQPGFECNRCETTEPPISWEAPIATFQCDKCGFSGHLGTRQSNH